MPPLVLLQPPGACRAFTRSGSSYPPLGLCQLAACVPAELASVVDADGEGWDDARTRSELALAAPLAVGMTVTTYTLDLVQRWAAEAHAIGARVVVGGPHASLEPMDVFARCPDVDIVVRGEAEPIFPELVARLNGTASLAGMAGVCVRGEGVSDTVLRVDDFDRLPFPSFQGLPLVNYGCPDALRRPMVTFMTARGCPHRCGFCSSPLLLGRKVRGWPIPRVLDELQRLVAQGVREVSFVDDVFTIQRERALALCDGMVARGLDLTWFCNARADQVTRELAAVMRQAGCHQVYLGFESGSPEILKIIHKDTTVERLERGAALLADAGIARSVGFVLGLPGETQATVDASIALARRVRPERIQFTRWTPLPGTPLARDEIAGGGGFHQREGDRVGGWIGRAYAECQGEGWGARSW
jgi:anaerobic magnesium-protoporphyrin IX monomethyl ester cyclase